MLAVSRSVSLPLFTCTRLVRRPDEPKRRDHQVPSRVQSRPVQSMCNKCLLFVLFWRNWQAQCKTWLSSCWCVTISSTRRQCPAGCPVARWTALSATWMNFWAEKKLWTGRRRQPIRAGNLRHLRLPNPNGRLSHPPGGSLAHLLSHPTMARRPPWPSKWTTSTPTTRFSAWWTCRSLPSTKCQDVPTRCRPDPHAKKWWWWRSWLSRSILPTRWTAASRATNPTTRVAAVALDARWKDRSRCITITRICLTIRRQDQRSNNNSSSVDPRPVGITARPTVSGAVGQTIGRCAAMTAPAKTRNSTKSVWVTCVCKWKRGTASPEPDSALIAGSLFSLYRNIKMSWFKCQPVRLLRRRRHLPRLIITTNRTTNNNNSSSRANDTRNGITAAAEGKSAR